MTSQVQTRLPVEATQLLVVGAGPVGLFAALCGAKCGLQVTLVEQDYRGVGRGHAAILHPSSLRLLADLGLSQRLLAEGRSIDKVDVYVDGGHQQSLDLAAPALSIPQAALEKILLELVREEAIDIHSPCQGTELTVHADSVQTRIVRRELSQSGSARDEGPWEPVESWLIDSAFVIGADGYESRVRTALAIESTTLGGTETFALFEGPSASESSTFELGFYDGLGSVSNPLPGGRTRWGFQLATDFHAPASVERVQELLAERMPWTNCRPTDLEWSTVSHFERRLSKRFGSGRVWLAGDAAHVTSPLGGQSMNRGFSEAYDFVQHMAGSIQQQAPIAALQQLGATQARDWHQLLGFNVSYSAKPGAPAWVGEHARRIVPSLPASGQDLQPLLAQLGMLAQ